MNGAEMRVNRRSERSRCCVAKLDFETFTLPQGVSMADTCPAAQDHTMEKTDDGALHCFVDMF